jgi:DNA (cytosine-5)-methyltransferase 1
VVDVDYISLFTGIGGLEAADHDPAVVCEIDEKCRDVLAARYPNTALVQDVVSFSPPKAGVVAGGWPCQDLSVAGRGAGLRGARSSLFYQMLRVATEASAETIVAENVPNLLRMGRGKTFRTALEAFRDAGFPHITWRTLNTRGFGLPHERNRVFILASRSEAAPRALFRETPTLPSRAFRKDPRSSGFYWTAGTQSICYSEGFSPTLKVGSGLSIPSPPAIHYGKVIRKMTPEEALRLQGFDPDQFRGMDTVSLSDIYRMAGNAVSAPVGKWVFQCLSFAGGVDIHRGQWIPDGPLAANGISAPDGTTFSVEIPAMDLCNNLDDFIDATSRDLLSSRAASGLLRRLRKSGKPIPEGLAAALADLVDE